MTKVSKQSTGLKTENQTKGQNKFSSELIVIDTDTMIAKKQCKGMCMKSLQRQADLKQKYQELNQLKQEREKIWALDFIYDTDRLLDVDQEIQNKEAEIAMIQEQLSKCMCYQRQCKFQNLTPLNRA